MNPIFARVRVAQRVRPLAVLFSGLMIGAAPGALATPFNVTGSDSSSKTLTGSETGTVTSTGNLTTSGIAVTVSGSTTTGPVIDNSGVISSTTKRGIDTTFKAGNVNLTITNQAGGLITAAQADTIRINADTGTGAVVINNSGKITMTGTGGTNGQALDLANITSTKSGLTVNNKTGGLITAADADAIRMGAGGVLNNAGTIKSFFAAGTGNASGNDAVDFQSNGNGTVNNLSGGLIEGARHAITGDNPITVSNDGTITGLDGAGINLDTKSTTTSLITNKGTITGNAVTADGDAIDVDGLATIDNYGALKAVGVQAPGGLSEAVTIGGGTINNFAGGTITSAQRAITIDDSNLGNAFAATTISNDGTITGSSGEVIKITSSFANSVTNKGAITGSVVLGSSTDTVNLYTGSTLTGALDGGAGNDAIHLTGAGNGALTNTANFETLGVDGGTWKITGTQNFSSGIIVANGATADVSGSLSGNLTNNGTVSVNKATASFTGTFTNNGLLVSDPATLNFDNLDVSATGAIQAEAGDLYVITGDFLNHSTQFGLWSTQDAALEFASGLDSAHTLLLAAADIGTSLLGFGNLSWNALTLDTGNTLSLGDGLGGGVVALYVNDIAGVLFTGNFVNNIFGNGFNIYYNPFAAANAYLGGLTYDLQNGGQLVADAPEPDSLALSIPAAGLLLLVARRRKRAAV